MTPDRVLRLQRPGPAGRTDLALAARSGKIVPMSTFTRVVRVDPTLLDGPVMDRGGATYVRLRVRPQKVAAPLKVFELELTDTSGVRRKETAAVALFYDASVIVAATFILRLSVEYQDVQNARIEVVYDASMRRARIRGGAARGAIDLVADVRGPDVGRSPEYEEFLDAPPDEQNEIRVSREGVLDLPAPQ